MRVFYRPDGLGPNVGYQSKGSKALRKLVEGEAELVVVFVVV